MKDKVLRYVWLAVFAGIAVYFGIYIYQMITILGSPYGLEYGDGWNAYVSSWWGNGGLNYIYPPIDTPLPFFNMPYTPLYYLITGVFYPLTGPVFWVGRVISILAAFGTCTLFFLIVRRITSNNWWGLVAAVLFFMPPVVRGWSLWFKNEPLALFFSFLGIYLVVRFVGTRKVLWCVLALLCAVYTKQTFISAAVAIGLYFLITNRKVFLQYFGLMAVGGLGLLVMFNYLTDGNFIPAIFAAPSGMPKSWYLSAFLMMLVSIPQWVIVILALCTVVFLVRKNRWSSTSMLLAFYFLISTTICAAVSTKSGGWLPYSYEMIPAAVVLLPILAWEFSKLKVKSNKLRIFYGNRYFGTDVSSVKSFQYLIPILLVIQLFMLPSYYAWCKLPDSTEHDYKIAMEYVNSIPKDIPIYSELEELMLWSGRDPLIEPSFYSQRVNSGKVDGTLFLSMIENKELGLIIQEWEISTYWYEAPEGNPSQGNWPTWMPLEIQKLYTAGRLRSTDALASAVKENYELAEHAGKFWIYKPKSE